MEYDIVIKYKTTNLSFVNKERERLEEIARTKAEIFNNSVKLSITPVED